ncbi:MAG: type II secretion system protein [Wolinella succinogenes]|uniref:type II secretion system protein n=1 Tax=Wolinella succinogenes TaxID=844 RepID=UPI00169765D1|nr:type II secretion system protein [Wolinella succinogenes]NLU34035.1 type II secretion system protein [Wolinella succinogenes]
MVRRSFTLIEAVFVIVILGIVGVAGSQAILRVYENYALQRAFNRLELESRRVVEQVARHLEYAIWDTITLDSATTLPSWRAKTMEAIWGTYVEDETSGRRVNEPLFSGYVDLKNSSDTTITTPLSKLNETLVGKELYFLRANTHAPIQTITDPTHLELASIPLEISDMAYVIEPEAYSLELVGAADNQKLNLKIGDDEYLMAEHVRSLILWREGQGSLLRLKVCMNDEQLSLILNCQGSGAGRGFCAEGFCKESVVMR